MAERWLVTGGTGQVGTALRRLNLPGIEIFAPSRSQLDLAKLPVDLEPFWAGISVILSCGAYTAVDKAESEPELAHAVNAEAPRLLAQAAAARGIPIIHVSTDYVFPADQKGPWSEDDHTSPVSVYGKTKLAGEDAIRRSGARHAIIRTAWVVSGDGNNFVKTMLRVGAQNSTVRVVADQHGTPTHAGDLAEALAEIAKRFLAGRQQASGTWHCTNSGETSWHGLAAHVFECAARQGLRVPDIVQAITTAEYPTAARRPCDSRLDCSKIETELGLKLRPWQIAAEEIVAKLAQETKQQ
jgi:dTDP-4-dehydrorhamnose reductase